MPKPKEGETKNDFISRCIPFVINEGTTDDPKQAAAICNSIWKKHHPGAKSETKDKLKDILLEIISDLREEDDTIKNKFHMDLRGNLNIINKSEDGRRIIAGYANIAVVDLEDQFIPVETLKKGIETLLSDPHYSNLMLVHQNIQIGKIISNFNNLETHVDDKGLFIVAEIRKDIETANEIWKSILDNEINGFSIGCEVISSHKKCDEEKCITILDEINIFEVSVCTKPVNEKSGFVVVSKSQTEYVCDSCEIIYDSMTKNEETKEKEVNTEEKSETTEETKEIVEETKSEEIVEESTVEEEKSEEPEIEELSIEDRVSNIEREISAMSEILQNLAKEPEEEPMEEETPEEEEKSEEEPELEEKQDPEEDEPKEDTPEGTEEEPEEEEDMPLPFKKSFDEIIEKLSSIAEKLSTNVESEDLKLSIKARDDQIKALEKKVEVLVKSEEEDVKPQTIQDESDNVSLEKDSPIKVHRGLVYYKE